PPMVVPAGSVPVVFILTAIWVGCKINGTVMVLEATTGVPAVALTLMFPASVLLRVTDATPPLVVAVADDRDPPLPPVMVNVTVVPSAIVPLAMFCGIRVAMRVTGPRLLVMPVALFATRSMDPSLLGSVKVIVW